mgnify:CR=1 FL=1
MLSNELIIKSTPHEIDIALLREGRLIELHKEKQDNSYAVGDIYLGKVKKLVPGLNAAFVDVGYEKDAFLHYHDLGPQVRSLNKYVKRTMAGKQARWMLSEFNLESDINKDGSIEDVLQVGQNLIVQVSKEPISTKGPRISTEISIAGRYLVLVPFSDRISVSQRVKLPEEKSRLRRLLKSIKPKGFGVIIRTVAEGKKVADLDSDLTQLLEKWHKLFGILKKAKPPQKVLGELGRASAILRDVLNDSFQQVYVEDKALYDEVKAYLSSIAPEKNKLIKHYSEASPIFEKFNVEKQIKTSFGRTVSMKRGAYLVIEHTEALHVIDVNSGYRTNNTESQEANALKINLLAAEEVARQLRLRDMGGIIVVDFIDLNLAENRKALYEALNGFMKDDRAKHKILPPSRFGLIEITRQRVRPEVNIKTAETCPTCNGSGEVEASVLIVDQIEDQLEMVYKDLQVNKVTLCVHPILYAFITKGPISIRMKWFMKYKKWMNVRPNNSYHLLQFTFFNKNDDEITF